MSQSEIQKSVLTQEFVPLGRPISAAELEDMQRDLRRRFRLTHYMADHASCGHFYYLRENSRKAKDLAATGEMRGDVGNCSVCWKENRTPAALRPTVHHVVKGYEMSYDQPLDYDKLDLTRVFYTWLYQEFNRTDQRSNDERPFGRGRKERSKFDSAVKKRRQRKRYPRRQINPEHVMRWYCSTCQLDCASRAELLTHIEQLHPVSKLRSTLPFNDHNLELLTAIINDPPSAHAIKKLVRTFPNPSRAKLEPPTVWVEYLDEVLGEESKSPLYDLTAESEREMATLMTAASYLLRCKGDLDRCFTEQAIPISLTLHFGYKEIDES